jgi:hypothetical protein
MMTGPFYVPPLTTPPLVENGILDNLEIHQWPSGIFEISLLVFFDEKREQFVIMDHLITGAAAVDGDDSDTEIKAVELDFLWLKQSRAKTMEGVDVELADVSEVVGSDSKHEVGPEDLPPDLASKITVTDTLTSEVNEEIESFLREEHPEQLEDEEV